MGEATTSEREEAATIRTIALTIGLTISVAVASAAGCSGATYYRETQAREAAAVACYRVTPPRADCVMILERRRPVGQ